MGRSSGQYSIDVTFPPSEVTVTGHVREIGGAPIAGASIWIFDDQFRPDFHALTNQDGDYFFCESMTGPYWVECAKAGYYTEMYGPNYPSACNPNIVDFSISENNCVVQSSPDAIIEDEPICSDDYVDNYNIGCIGAAWDTIPQTCEVYGTSGIYFTDNIEIYDTDWFEFDLANYSVFELKAIAEFDYVISIIKQGPTIPCEESEMFFSKEGLECDTAFFDTTLGQGKYWITVTSRSVNNVGCGSKYYFSLNSQTYPICDYAAGDLNQQRCF